MTKADIVNEIAKKTGIDRVTVLTTVEAFMNSVKDSLDREQNVYLRGFGSFILKKRAEKTARNISKNTTLIIPEHNIPAFKPAKSFLQSISKLNGWYGIDNSQFSTLKYKNYAKRKKEKKTQDVNAQAQKKTEKEQT